VENDHAGPFTSLPSQLFAGGEATLAETAA
jgi:hypothetical protein